MAFREFSDLSVETRHVVEEDCFVFWHLNGFNFIVNISERSFITNSIALSLVVAFFVQDYTDFRFFVESTIFIDTWDRI